MDAGTVHLMLQVGTFTAVVAMLATHPRAFKSLLDLTGPALSQHPSSPAGSRFRSTLALGMLVVIALFFVMNPEVRTLLLLIDALGVDMLLVLLGLQLQGWLVALHPLVIAPLRRLLTTLRS